MIPREVSGPEEVSPGYQTEQGVCEQGNESLGFLYIFGSLLYWWTVNQRSEACSWKDGLSGAFSVTV